MKFVFDDTRRERERVGISCLIKSSQLCARIRENSSGRARRV